MKILKLLTLTWFFGLPLCALATSGPVAPRTVPCQTDMEFPNWIQGVYSQALAAGVSRATLQTAVQLGLLRSDPIIIQRDHAQGAFYDTFLYFFDRHAVTGRLINGANAVKKYPDQFARIKQQYGIPAEVLASYWGLESDFTNGIAKDSVNILTAVTTLAYDCRRSDFFRQQLIDALLVATRGDLAPDQMIGDWAGELGGLQITPTDYLKFGVDYDGDNRSDVVYSVPDMLGTAAHYLSSLGWERDQPWLQEVRVPMDMAWDQADFVNPIYKTRAQWSKLGVQAMTGTLPKDDLTAVLVLPMGHLGPAFLAFPNFFNAYMQWNASLTYSLTAAYLANEIGYLVQTGVKPPPLSRGNGTPIPLDEKTQKQVTEMQQLLIAHGFAVGLTVNGDPKKLIVDGTLGLATRAAVKKAQQYFRMAVDSYPTPELLDQLRQMR